MMPRDMSRTALLDALETFDLDRIRTLLRSEPELNDWRDEKGLNLLQICCSRSTVDDPAAARRQLQVARWLVSQGFDPRAIHTTAAGEDGEEDPAEVSLALFAVARARNNALARYFLEQGAPPGALFAAAWSRNGDIPCRSRAPRRRCQRGCRRPAAADGRGRRSARNGGQAEARQGPHGDDQASSAFPAAGGTSDHEM
jgi:hypothetical protein